MPAPGDQHSATANPFEEAKTRVSEFSAQEIATLQSRLEKQLGPEYLSSRTGPSGQKVHYIAAEKCIALANEVFGFNGWSSSIQNIQVDFVDENPQTLKISLGLSVIVRVTLRDGTFHEDIGYGHIENCKGKAAAFEKAKKEGTTDALKRTLRNFGNVLGNCIYDKAYLQKVTKLKVEPSRFDEGGLHRHADYIKKEEAIKVDSATSTSGGTVSAADTFEDLLGDFDEADFCVTEEEHPDEVSIADSVQQSHGKPNQPSNQANMQPPSRPLGRSSSTGSNYVRQPQTPNQAYSRPGAQNLSESRPQPQQTNGLRPPPPQNAHTPQRGGPNGPGPVRQVPPQQQQAASHNPAPGSEPVAFFSARAVPKDGDDRQNAATPIAKPGMLFNPRAESPSIRKTEGIDHTTSKPLGRHGQHVAPAQPNDTSSAPSGPGPVNNNSAGRPATSQMGRGNVVNPQLSHARQIGAPGGPGSPLANRGQYRPPTMKRPPPPEAGRPALVDVSNSGPGNAVMPGSGGDVKRQKMN